jgi:hypothetical protein
MTRRFNFVGAMIIGALLVAAAPLKAQPGGANDPAPRQLRFFRAPQDSAVAATPIDPADAQVLRLKIAVNADGVPLYDALRAIANASGLRFVYATDAVDADHIVHFMARDVTVAAALTAVLRDSPVSVILRAGDYAVLVPDAAGLAKRDPLAREVRLRLLDEGTRQPLAGALVSVFAADKLSGRSVLSSRDGIVIAHPVGAGPYRLLVRRIGFAPFTADVGDLAGASADVRSIAIPARRITLNTVRVVATQTCPDDAKSPSSAAELAWTEVRGALEASALTRDQRLVTTTALRFRRELRIDGTILRTDTTLRGLSGERPFVAPPPAVLERDGYLKDHADGSEDFYGPDEYVLLSGGFTRLHCVSAYPEIRRDERGTQLALAFAPRDKGTSPELHGLIWIDSATSELRRIDFDYVRVPLPADSLGGSVEFTHLASGGWIISSWSLRLPRWRVVDHRRGQVALDGYSEFGGTASVVREGATSDAALVGTIVGVVIDSISNQPLAGARVHLPDLTRDAVTDSAGAFRFDGVTPGTHPIWADHPVLDALGLFSIASSVDVAAKEVARLTLAIPSFETLWNRACGSAVMARDRFGFVYGRVRLGDSPQAPADASVDVGWAPDEPDSAGKPRAAAKKGALADASGAYAICGIPTSRTVTLSADAGGTSTIPVSFRLGTQGIARRDITIPSIDAMNLALADTLPSRTQRSESAVLTGVVRDSTGRPLRDARVTVSGVSGEWSADAAGAFVVRGIPPGTRAIVVRAPGFVPERRLADFAARDSANLDVAISQLVTTLRTVTVLEREHYNELKAELDQRRRAGFGYRADSTAFANVLSVGQALNFPGVHVTVTGSEWGIYMTGVYHMASRGGSGIALTCVPTVWIDGMVSDWLMVNELRKDEIALIEVYNSAARAPLQFSGTRTNCGVVLVWRKRYIDP